MSEKNHVDVVGIGLDTSGSMSGILKIVSHEAMEFLQSFQPEKVIFCQFASEITCTNMDLVSAQKCLLDMTDLNANGRTAMFDGVTSMLHELIQFAKEGKKVVAIVVTDGYENASVRFTRNDLENAKDTLRRMAGSDSIREICISNNIQEANALLNATPGLSRDHSSSATREKSSIHAAFQKTNTPV